MAQARSSPWIARGGVGSPPLRLRFADGTAFVDNGDEVVMASNLFSLVFYQSCGADGERLFRQRGNENSETMCGMSRPWFPPPPQSLIPRFLIEFGKRRACLGRILGLVPMGDQCLVEVAVEAASWLSALVAWGLG